MSSIRHDRGARSALGALLALLLLALLAAAPARADFGLLPGDAGFHLSTTTTQAGDHPDLTTDIGFNTVSAPGGTFSDQHVRNIDVNLPAGLIGSQPAAPTCAITQLQDGNSSFCKPATQVGTATLTVSFGGFLFPFHTGLYNLTRSRGETAKLGFVVAQNPIILHVGVRPDDAGLVTTIRNVPEPYDVINTSVTIWGVPADPSHDAERLGGPFGPSGLSAGIAPKPFLTNPTQCTGQPIRGSVSAAPWENPADVVSATSELPPITGCDRLHFDPSISVVPDVTQADSPSGYTVKLSVPQTDDPNTLATANLRNAVVKLPPGVTLSPAVADGLEACADDRLGLSTADAPSCPAGSKLGTVSLVTPALPDALGGSIYLRPPTANDPYRIVLVISGDGVMLKIPGSVKPDPATGQLTTTFPDSPRQPFSELTLQFKGGSRAPLTTPAACGQAQTTTALTPWNSETAATPSSVFDVSWDGNGAACPTTLPFTPGFEAGVTNPIAGAHSPFVFRLTRDDRNQTLSQIGDVHLPAGLTARVTGVPLCDEAAAAAGTCGAGSQIGSAAVASGAGSSPLRLGGKVFLTKGYKGAPFGLSIVVPAIAGPFDLGTVVVRAAVRVNSDASLTVDADPLPTVLQGIPLRMRDIALNLDRPGFMLNPTSCDPMAATAKISAVEGAVANVSDRFQVTNCAALGFAPRITATTRAGNSTAKGASLHVTVAGRGSDANLRTVTFTLPSQMGANLNTTKNACTQAQYEAGKCGPLAKVGTAKAITGILPEPMVGDVYLVSQKGGLPKLAMMLQGNGISIPLNGVVSFARNRTVTTFDAIPDVPITRFDLDLPMGKVAAVTSTVNVCDATLTAPTRAIGQNGKSLDQSTRVVAQGCRLRIAKVAVGHGSARLTISGLQPGTLTASGGGIVAVRRRVGTASVTSLTVKLNGSAKAAVARSGRLRGRVTVRLAPAGGKAQRASRTITFKK